MVLQLPSIGGSLPSNHQVLFQGECLCNTVQTIHAVSQSAIKCYYDNTNRHVRNVISGSIATCCSYWGGAIAGDMCVRSCLHLATDGNTAARIGSALAACGNCWSWISSYEKPSETDSEIAQMKAQQEEQENKLKEQDTQIKTLVSVVELQAQQITALSFEMQLMKAKQPPSKQERQSL